MGKLFRNRRWAIALASCLLAAVFNVSLTVFGTQISTTYCDDHVMTRGPEGNPIIPFGFNVADTFCARFGSEPKPDPHQMVAAFATTSGLFARQPENRRLGLVGGIIAPLFLILFGTYVASPSRRPLIHIAAIMSFLTGTVFSVLFVFFLLGDPMLIARPAQKINLEELSLSLIFLVPAAIFIAGGIPLWRISIRPKL